MAYAKNSPAHKAFKKRQAEKMRKWFVCARCHERKPCHKSNLYDGKVCRECKGRAQLSISGPNSVGAQAWKDEPRRISSKNFDKNGLHWYGSAQNGGPIKGQRRLAAERDNHRCRVPGCKSYTPRVEVHHKVPFKISEDHRLVNLITLCRDHHLKVEAFIDDTGACPYVWPLLDFDPDASYIWPPPPPGYDPDDPPF